MIGRCGKFRLRNRINRRPYDIYRFFMTVYKISKSEKTTLISPDMTGALTGRAGAGRTWRNETGKKGSFLIWKIKVLIK